MSSSTSASKGIKIPPSSPQDPIKYDVIAIGSGGGAKITTPAHKLGMRVAMCEKDDLGGTCLNRGCIPSKMVIYPAMVAEHIRDAAKYYDIEVPGGYKVPAKNWERLFSRVTASVKSDSDSIRPGYEKDAGKVLYTDRAEFVAPKVLRSGKHYITADRIFIAAGSRPHLPPACSGLRDTPFMTSTEALRLTKKPKSMIVLGAGYISVELAYAYALLGVNVTVIARSTVLSRFDRELGDEFRKHFSHHCTVLNHSEAVEVKYSKGTFTATIVTKNPADGSKKTSTLTSDAFLVATGVTPNSDTLALDKAGIKVNPKTGFIEVDEHLRTSAPNVWAFGDVAGNYLFRHSANYEGEYLLENVIHPLAKTGKVPDYPPIDYTGMPWAVFSSPQLAGVGESEDELKARGASYVVGYNRYSSSAYGMALHNDIGAAKVFVERGTRRILGASILGEEASMLIHELTPIVRMKGKLEDVLYSIHIHPAANEIVRNACRKARDALVAAGDEIPLRLSLK